MDAQLKAKWVEALRSGKYVQAKGRLRRDDGFCCLGVLCDISGEGHWAATTETGIQQYEHAGYRSVMYLPPMLKTHYRLSDALELLMEMNDTDRTFSEIADYIEQNIPASEARDDR